MARVEKVTALFSSHAKKRLRERVPRAKFHKFKDLTQSKILEALRLGATVSQNGELRVEVMPTVYIACYPSLMGGWEVATVFRAGDMGIRYAGTANLVMAELDLSGVTTGEQAQKVIEEWDEFLREQNGDVDMERVAEEALDVIQAIHGYLQKLGVDVKSANRKHLKKMKERY